MSCTPCAVAWLGEYRSGWKREAGVATKLSVGACVAAKRVQGAGFRTDLQTHEDVELDAAGDRRWPDEALRQRARRGALSRPGARGRLARLPGAGLRGGRLESTSLKYGRNTMAHSDSPGKRRHPISNDWVRTDRGRGVALT